MNSQLYALKYQQLFREDLEQSRLRNKIFMIIATKCIRNSRAADISTQEKQCIDKQMGFVEGFVAKGVLPSLY